MFSWNGIANADDVQDRTRDRCGDCEISYWKGTRLDWEQGNSASSNRGKGTELRSMNGAYVVLFNEHSSQTCYAQCNVKPRFRETFRKIRWLQYERVASVSISRTPFVVAAAPQGHDHDRLPRVIY